MWSITNRLKYWNYFNLIYTDIYGVCRKNLGCQRLKSVFLQLGCPSVNHRLMIKVRISEFGAKTKKKICEKPFGIKVKRIIINSKWLLVFGSHEINSGFHGIHSEYRVGLVEKSKKRSRSFCQIFENAVRLQLLYIHNLVTIYQDYLTWWFEIISDLTISNRVHDPVSKGCP